MNITNAVPLMLRAAKRDVKRARSQKWLGICACLFAAGMAVIVVVL